MEGRTYKGLERPSLVWSKDVGRIRSCLGKGRKVLEGVLGHTF